MPRPAPLLIAAALVAAAPRAAMAGPPPLPLAATSVALPPLPNPPGDIPDTQVFVPYRSPLGFSLKVPEGWARRETAAGVRFSNAYDGLAVTVTATAAPPSAASVRNEQAVALAQSPQAVRIAHIDTLHLPGGEAVHIVFASNSEPNAVTGKAVRQENEQYLFWSHGRLATLTLWAPFGADNADQWQLISRSFRW
jgi:hypothetical protein